MRLTKAFLFCNGLEHGLCQRGAMEPNGTINCVFVRYAFKTVKISAFRKYVTASETQTFTGDSVLFIQGPYQTDEDKDKI